MGGDELGVVFAEEDGLVGEENTEGDVVDREGLRVGDEDCR